MQIFVDEQYIKMLLANPMPQILSMMKSTWRDGSSEESFSTLKWTEKKHDARVKVIYFINFPKDYTFPIFLPTINLKIHWHYNIT